MWDLVRFILIYTFYYVFFIIFYYTYLEILKFKIYSEKCAKSKWEKQKETEVVSWEECHNWNIEGCY